MIRPSLSTFCWAQYSSMVMVEKLSSPAGPSLCSAWANESWPTRRSCVVLSDHRPRRQLRMFSTPFSVALLRSMPSWSAFGSNAWQVPPAWARRRAIRITWSPK
ncbi:hypothetical protein D3C85_1227270 [compost metagenome]